MDVLGQLVQNAVDGSATTMYGEFVETIYVNDDDAADSKFKRIRHSKSSNRSSGSSISQTESTESTGWMANQMKCEECRGIFSHEASLKQHMRRYHRQKEFECPVCQNGYRKAIVLQSHIQTMHPDLDVADMDDPRRSHKESKVWALERQNLALKRKIDDFERLAEDSSKHHKEEIEAIRKEKQEQQTVVEDLAKCFIGKQMELDEMSAKCQQLESDLKETTAKLAEQARDLNAEKSKLEAEISELKEDSKTSRQKLLDFLNQM